ncbi:MAG TPA: ATP-binding protein [Caulobacteraceae bacterium]|jgi:signal transduction histidine kinase|nr:ATP-binding protein [Caulobacteraceae bacterium]
MYFGSAPRSEIPQDPLESTPAATPWRGLRDLFRPVVLPVVRYFGSIAGLLFVILLIGALSSATLAWEIADAHRRSDIQRIRFDRVVDRVEDFVLTTDRVPAAFRKNLILQGFSDLHSPTGRERASSADPELAARLAARVGVKVSAMRAVSSSCFPEWVQPDTASQFDCWIISTRLSDGAPLKLVLATHTNRFAFPDVDPMMLLLLVSGMAALAFAASRMAAAPLGELSRAARALGGDIDRPPLPERGLYEVRDAARALNAMQAKLRGHIVERTHILASITHDLKTPLTRLRLRVEKVDNPALQSRLIDDLEAMDALIHEGLDFSRSSQTEEPFSPMALDSLLASVVEDAAEGGRPAVLLKRCGCDVIARPRALQRCLANLIDNALNYGGSAEVSASADDDRVVVRIRDHGPGIPANKLESVFEPFVRLETSRSRETGGVGLGLTIAKMLAQKNNADLALVNHPDGGLEARLIIPLTPPPEPA